MCFSNLVVVVDMPLVYIWEDLFCHFGLSSRVSSSNKQT